MTDQQAVSILITVTDVVLSRMGIDIDINGTEKNKRPNYHICC